MNFIDRESPRKLRGGYYTPPDIALFLSRWVCGARPQRILEPSCGDGVFLRALAAAGGDAEVVGVELDPQEAAAASQAAQALPVPATVLSGDFLGWSLDQEGTPFGAVVGNPPFIRYQYLDASAQQRAEAVFRRQGLPFTRHTNAWVSVVVAALALLQPGGRLAMVVPAELLVVLHAQSLRDYLRRVADRVLVVDPEELWFDDALQGVVLLMVEKATGPTARGAVALQAVSGRDFLAASAETLWAQASFVEGDELAGKWMLPLLSASDRALLRALDAHPHVARFADVATVTVGIVTGANPFFLVPEETVVAHDLAPYARPMFGRSEHVPGVIYDNDAHNANVAAGLPTQFLDFGATPFDALTAGAQAYVRDGEAQGLHQRYKCRIRTPWTHVPSVVASPVAMLKRSHDHPRLVWNAQMAYTTDTAYRITPTGVGAKRLVASFVNALTVLSAELEGRHYGGGVLELVPSEIRRLRVPLAPDAPVDLAALDQQMRARLPSQAVLAAQDARVLAPLGLAPADCLRLRDAWDLLRRRRQRKPVAAPEDMS